MALTLAEGAKLSNDVLLEGVIETVINDSPVLQRLPFVEIVGNGLTYNRENAAATAAFYAVGDAWAESTPTFTQITAALKILGGDADVDNYLATDAQQRAGPGGGGRRAQGEGGAAEVRRHVRQRRHRRRREGVRRHRQAVRRRADGLDGHERRARSRWRSWTS